ncbi:MAG: cisplatin damage response ATP-dependent DNA ligase [Candidatus Puniceispirillaceae bacterium]
MKSFATLLENLVFSPGRNAKIAHLVSWLKATSGNSRGYGVAAITGDLSLPHVKGAMIRQLAASTTDEVLFALSYDFVGDLAETVSLLWPARQIHDQEKDGFVLGDMVQTLQNSTRKEAEERMRYYLDNLDQTQRWALLKLATGGLRVGVSARLMRVSLATAFDRAVEDIEEIWPLIEPPYEPLFDWLEGRAERPKSEGRAVFKPLMLANPLEVSDRQSLSLQDFQIEWKWDGARVQLVSAKEGVRLFSRSGDDISSAFPELIQYPGFLGVLDGELLAGTKEQLGSFNELQKRLNRKKASAKMQAEQPVFMRCYDLLAYDETDLRQLALTDRRRMLEAYFASDSHTHLDLSPLISAPSWDELEAIKDQCRTDPLIEGVMLKRKNAPYQLGRISGQWYKWKRDPLFADLVILYAQRGHGRRSSQYSDFTFGAWQASENGPVLVPVGKAYSGFTDQELRQLDKFVRDHTVAKYGPVREVEPKLVIEAAFDSIHLSNRHKSGVAMRFPRFHAIRWDKDIEEADTVDMLKKYVT